MNLRSCGVVIGFAVLLSVTGAGVCTAQEEQGAADQVQQSMLPEFVQNDPEARQDVVNEVRLNIYEAAKNDLSLCNNDPKCLKKAKRLKYWMCAADVCSGKDNSKKPVDCFDEFREEYSQDVLDRINGSLCPYVLTPNSDTRQPLLKSSGTKESSLVEYGAYLLALKGSADACQKYLKNYFGAYGSQWNMRNYRALSGCRILSGETTREQEEKDFYTWFGAEEGADTCSNIVNSELSYACNTPGAGSPRPTYDP